MWLISAAKVQSGDKISPRGLHVTGSSRWHWPFWRITWPLSHLTWSLDPILCSFPPCNHRWWHGIIIGLLYILTRIWVLCSPKPSWFMLLYIFCIKIVKQDDKKGKMRQNEAITCSLSHIPFYFFFTFCMQKMQKKNILNCILNAQHPSAVRNIYHLINILHTNWFH